MRDPMAWAFPLPFRLFGITVRVHFLFVILVLVLILRESFRETAPAGAAWQVAILCGLLFVAVLLHELGHCFGARAVDGDASEILMWPLGGLAYVEVPHTPRAHFVTVAAGPGTNLGLCALTAVVLAFASYVPSFNPITNPYQQQLYNWREGVTHGSSYKPAYYRATPGGLEAVKADQVALTQDGKLVLKDNHAEAVQARVFGGSVNVLAMFFWINWVLFLFNVLLLGFPMDGGRLVQCFVWWRSGDYRQATSVAVNAGYVTAVVLLIAGLVVNDTLLVLLAMFVYFSCFQQRFVLEHGMEESPFGYDFSQGYTSLEKGDAPPPKPKRVNPVRRWLQQRAARKAARLAEQREVEDRRMDGLLEKIQREGSQALTDEERRFLTRVSARYRNRQ